MILTKEVEIILNAQNVNFYKNLGYDCKPHDKIIVPIEHLSNGSNYKINVKCDKCDKIKNIRYCDYLKTNKNGDLCKKCNYEKTKITKIDKYGSENYYNLEKCKKTNIEKYGVENVFQNEEIKSKIKDIFLEKYNVDNYSKTEEFKEKFKNTCLEKYGVDNYTKTKEYKEKVKITCQEKYGRNHKILSIDAEKMRSEKWKENQKSKTLKKYPEILNIKDNLYFLYCNKCNTNFTLYSSLFFNRKNCKTILCTNCNPINSHTNSGYEIQLQNFIKDNYTSEIILNSRNIIDKELDIYLPNLKLAFEFNGLYWHNEINKQNNYHLNKTKKCEEKGIQLIHIWEDDWLYKQEIIKSMILNKLGKTKNKIFARKCEIKKIENNKLIKLFLNDNHIQGFVGSLIKIGLFHNNELISLMTFGKKRKFMNFSSKEGEYELLRFCNKLNTNVIGAASKLFKYFIENYIYVEITTYADRSYSNGKLYNILGFEFVNKTEPNYYYIINGIRLHRFNFRKDLLVKEGYDKNKTEHEIMINRNIYRIYDSGNLKFKITPK